MRMGVFDMLLWCFKSLEGLCEEYSESDPFIVLYARVMM